MDEYIKREDALDAVLFALVGTGLQSTAIYALRDIPPADVAPKSEVAREIIDDFDEELHKLAERYYEQGKIEYFTLCEVIYQLVLAKIKKKYTEEKK